LIYVNIKRVSLYRSDEQMMEQNNRARVDWLDNAKGFGIILIFFGHIFSTIDPGIVNIWIYSFHVPLFFYLAGVTWSNRDPGDVSFIIKKAKRLLMPYAAFGILGYLFYISGYLFAIFAELQLEQFNYGLMAPLLGLFYGTLGEGRLINGPIWFLMALFVSLVLYKIMMGFQHKYKINRFIVLILLLALAYLSLVVLSSLTLPWSIVPALGALLFIGLSHQLKIHNWVLKLKFKELMAVVIVASVLSGLGVINGFVAYGDGLVNNFFFFILFALNGIVLTIAVSKLIDGKSKWLKRVGQNSLQIMVTHILIIKVVKVGMQAFMGISFSFVESDLIFGMVAFIISACLTIPCVLIINKYFSWSLGGKYI